MRNKGIDVLRGLGVFTLLGLHSAFYYFDGLYDLDLNNPPLIITIIGFLLMFAGMFAIISGYGHVRVMKHELSKGTSTSLIVKKQLASALFILVVAYLYFVFTGPGIVHFETQSMNNSILVEWIQSGNWVGISLERLIYIDSLVMIGVNIALLGLVYPWLAKRKWASHQHLFWLFIAFFVVSLVRIPLYPIFMTAWENENWFVVILLNLLVNKNNPIFPYFAFALLGAWVVELEDNHRQKQQIWVSLGFLVVGITAYILLPDTMLERAIDLKWFAIMTIQIGLFLVMIRGFMAIKRLNIVTRFLERLGLYSLTPFFFESILAALVFRFMNLFIPVSFDISGALVYGFTLAILWGFCVVWIAARRPKWTLEALYSRFISKNLESTKAIYLESDHHL